jgi:hypothetical protein
LPLGSILTFTGSLLLAKISLRKPPGSAAVTAMPATITLSRRSFQSLLPEIEALQVMQGDGDGWP